MSIINPLRHHTHLTDPNQDSFAERLSESVASGMGTVKFIVGSTVFISVWIALNVVGWIGKWDAYPFILLNLFFSAVAFYTGALVIIAQKAQSKRDKATAIADAKHREELHAELMDLQNQQVEMLKEIKTLTEAVAKLAVVAPSAV